MQTFNVPTPVETEVIRTSASGPEPFNTLAFMRCAGAGVEIDTDRADTLFTYRVHFLSKFQIDGFTQANIDWYRANTLVSATAVVNLYNATNDTNFACAVDAVAPFIDLTGALGFDVDLAHLVGALGVFEHELDIAFDFKVSAYVLLFEPVTEMPRFGGVRRLEAFSPSSPWQPMPNTKIQRSAPADRARIRVTRPRAESQSDEVQPCRRRPAS